MMMIIIVKKKVIKYFYGILKILVFEIDKKCLITIRKLEIH